MKHHLSDLMVVSKTFRISDAVERIKLASLDSCFLSYFDQEFARLKPYRHAKINHFN